MFLLVKPIDPFDSIQLLLLSYVHLFYEISFIDLKYSKCFSATESLESLVKTTQLLNMEIMKEQDEVGTERLNNRFLLCGVAGRLPQIKYASVKRIFYESFYLAATISSESGRENIENLKYLETLFTSQFYFLLIRLSHDIIYDTVDIYVFGVISIAQHHFLSRYVFFSMSFQRKTLSVFLSE